MPLSNAVCSGSSDSDWAMPPRNVSFPVATTTAVAEPLSTLVPRNAMLVRSMGAVVAAFFSTSNFSTGKLSPVSELCVTNRSFAATMRTSAGIMSPAASSTMSPGTSCETAISWGVPSRIDGGGDRDHGLELGRCAVGLGFLDEFQPHAQSDHERHHDPRPRVTGGE